MTRPSVCRVVTVVTVCRTENQSVEIHDFKNHRPLKVFGRRREEEEEESPHAMRFQCTSRCAADSLILEAKSSGIGGERGVLLKDKARGRNALLSEGNYLYISECGVFCFSSCHWPPWPPLPPRYPSSPFLKKPKSTFFPCSICCLPLR